MQAAKERFEQMAAAAKSEQKRMSSFRGNTNNNANKNTKPHIKSTEDLNTTNSNTQDNHSARSSNLNTNPFLNNDNSVIGNNLNTQPYSLEKESLGSSHHLKPASQSNFSVDHQNQLPGKPQPFNASTNPFAGDSGVKNTYGSIKSNSNHHQILRTESGKTEKNCKISHTRFV